MYLCSVAKNACAPLTCAYIHPRLITPTYAVEVLALTVIVIQLYE